MVPQDPRAGETGREVVERYVGALVQAYVGVYLDHRGIVAYPDIIAQVGACAADACQEFDFPIVGILEVYDVPSGIKAVIADLGHVYQIGVIDPGADE